MPELAKKPRLSSDDLAALCLLLRNIEHAAPDNDRPGSIQQMAREGQALLQDKWW